MRRFRLAFLSLFVVKNALAQEGEPPKPAPPPPTAPAPAEEADPGDEEIPAEGDEAPPAPSEPKPDAGKKSPPPAKEKEEAPAEEPTGDDEISDAELEAELEGPDMKKAPPKGQGAVVGVIRDTKFNEPLIEAQVEVVGLKKRTFTD